MGKAGRGTDGNRNSTYLPGGATSRRKGSTEEAGGSGGDRGTDPRGDVGRSQGRNRSRKSLTVIQRPTRMTVGGRSHSGGSRANIWRQTDGDSPARGGAQGEAEQAKSQNNTVDPEGQGGACGQDDRGEGGDPEDRGKARATEDVGGWRRPGSRLWL